METGHKDKNGKEICEGDMVRTESFIGEVFLNTKNEFRVTERSRYYVDGQSKLLSEIKDIEILEAPEANTVPPK